jgi:dihydrodipicolinate synthase/N-acetylneuraminate lyase
MTRLGEGVVLGAMAAVIAPRRENGHTIDISLALDILDFVNERGVKGVAVLGATGEFIHYDVEERMRLAMMAVRRSRTPVIVNVSHSTLEGAVVLARNATEVGATALLLMPPHFFRHSQEGIIAYYKEFARQAAGLAPTLLYNLPFFTNGMEAATACTILETGQFAGIKDSSGNVELFDALHALRQRIPFRLLLGNDRLLASHRALADGVISGCASGVPELIPPSTAPRREATTRRWRAVAPCSMHSLRRSTLFRRPLVFSSHSPFAVSPRPLRRFRSAQQLNAAPPSSGSGSRVSWSLCARSASATIKA